MQRAHPGILVAILAVLGPLLAAQDDAVRTLESAGVRLALPEEWTWAGDGSTALEASRQIEDEGNRSSLRVEVRHHPRTLVASILAGQWQLVEGQQQDPNGTIDRSSVKVAEKLSLGGRRGALRMSYEWVANKTAVRSSVSRWLVERDGDAIECIEIASAPRTAAVDGAFEAARKGLQLLKAPTPAVTHPNRTYVNQRLRFKLPEGWLYTEGARSRRVEENAEGRFVTLFAAEAGAVDDGRGLLLRVSCQATKSTQTPEAWLERGRENVMSNWLEVQDVVIDDRDRIAGQKAVTLSFTGAIKTTRGAGPRRAVRLLVFGHKGHLLLWQEVKTPSDSRALKKLVSQGRKALKPA